MEFGACFEWLPGCVVQRHVRDGESGLCSRSRRAVVRYAIKRDCRLGSDGRRMAALVELVDVKRDADRTSVSGRNLCRPGLRRLSDYHDTAAATFVPFCILGLHHGAGRDVGRFALATLYQAGKYRWAPDWCGDSGFSALLPIRPPVIQTALHKPHPLAAVSDAACRQKKQDSFWRLCGRALKLFAFQNDIGWRSGTFI